MIVIQDLEMRYGAKVLFERVNLQLVQGSAYGLVGANGSGKSTFLKILSGEEPVPSGSVQIAKNQKLGLLKQDHFKYEKYSLMDTVLAGKPDLVQAREEMDKLMEAEVFSDEESSRFSELEEVLQENDSYTAESDVSKLLEGLGIAEEKHSSPMSTLSGGYKLRVLLAQVLFSQPEILLLDEPTNHLDLMSIHWLELYLKKYKGLLMIISHDRDFINSVCSHILDIDYGSIIVHKGNYDHYRKVSAEKNVFREAALEKSSKKKEQLQKFVDRFKSKASKARQAQSKSKVIEKLEEEMTQNEFKASTRRAPGIKFPAIKASSPYPLKVTEIGKSFKNLKVLNEVSFEVEAGDRLAILGPNGIGKSTLLKIIVGNLKADTGSTSWGHHSKYSYFPQDFEGVFDGGGTLLEWLGENRHEKTENELRTALGRVLFSGDDVHKKVNVLSGGEMARMFLAKIMLEESNVLIMDEPTNHLDLESVDALTEALMSYAGTVIFVSHNRYFVSHIANRYIEILSGGARDFRGNFEEAIMKMSSDHLSRDLKLKKRFENQEVQEEKVESVKMTKEEKAEVKGKQKVHRATIRVLEKQISEAEKEISAIEERMGQNDFYEKTEGKEQKELVWRHGELKSGLETNLESWEKETESLDVLTKSLG